MEQDIASLHSWLQGRLAEMNRVSPLSVMLVNRSIEPVHGSSLSMSKDGHRERRRLRGRARASGMCALPWGSGHERNGQRKISAGHGHCS